MSDDNQKIKKKMAAAAAAVASTADTSNETKDVIINQDDDNIDDHCDIDEGDEGDADDTCDDVLIGANGVADVLEDEGEEDAGDAEGDNPNDEDREDLEKDMDRNRSSKIDTAILNMLEKCPIPGWTYQKQLYASGSIHSCRLRRDDTRFQQLYSGWETSSYVDRELQWHHCQHMPCDPTITYAIKFTIIGNARKDASSNNNDKTTTKTTKPTNTTEARPQKARPDFKISSSDKGRAIADATLRSSLVHPLQLRARRRILASRFEDAKLTQDQIIMDEMGKEGLLLVYGVGYLGNQLIYMIMPEGYGDFASKLPRRNRATDILARFRPRPTTQSQFDLYLRGQRGLNIIDHADNVPLSFLPTATNITMNTYRTDAEILKRMDDDISPSRVAVACEFYKTARWMHQIITGIHNLHIKGIAHNDLKPQNIIITRSEHACVSDLESACMAYQKPWLGPYTEFKTTPKYNGYDEFASMSPCLMVDIWPIGLMLLRFLGMFNTDEICDLDEHGDEVMSVGKAVELFGERVSMEWVKRFCSSEKYINRVLPHVAATERSCDDKKDTKSHSVSQAIIAKHPMFLEMLKDAYGDKYRLFTDMIDVCLRADMRDRASARELLNMPFWSEITHMFGFKVPPISNTVKVDTIVDVVTDSHTSATTNTLTKMYRDPVYPVTMQLYDGRSKATAVDISNNNNNTNVRNIATTTSSATTRAMKTTRPVAAPQPFRAIPAEQTRTQWNVPIDIPDIVLIEAREAFDNIPITNRITYVDRVSLIISGMQRHQLMESYDYFRMVFCVALGKSIDYVVRKDRDASELQMIDSSKSMFQKRILQLLFDRSFIWYRMQFSRTSPSTTSTTTTKTTASISKIASTAL